MCLRSSSNRNRLDYVTRTKQCVHWVIIRRESSTQSSREIVEMQDLWRICFHYLELADWLGMTLQMTALSEDFAVYTKSMAHRWNPCFWYKHKIRILSLYHRNTVLTISTVQFTDQTFTPVSSTLFWNTPWKMGSREADRKAMCASFLSINFTMYKAILNKALCLFLNNELRLLDMKGAQ